MVTLQVTTLTEVFEPHRMLDWSAEHGVDAVQEGVGGRRLLAASLGQAASFSPDSAVPVLLILGEVPRAGGELAQGLGQHVVAVFVVQVDGLPSSAEPQRLAMSTPTDRSRP